MKISVNFLHVILLNALALAISVAVFAGKTSPDVLFAHIDYTDFMARFFSSIPESGKHFCRVAPGPGTPV